MTSVAAWFLVLVAALPVTRWAFLAALTLTHRSGSAAASTSADWLPPLTVLVPAYNEEAVLTRTVRSVLASDYPELRVLIIDDCSTDGTLGVARALECSDVRIGVVAQRTNGGKAVALNAGLRHAETALVVVVDADTMLEPTALRRAVRRMQAEADVVAVSGTVKVCNRINFVTWMQSVQYIVMCEQRRAQERLGMLTTVPGAFGLFRRSALLEVGGYPTAGAIEDTEITVALHAAGWRVRACPEAVAWTEVPETWRALVKQRDRWKGGFLSVLRDWEGTPSDARMVRRGALDVWLREFAGIPLLGIGFLAALLSLDLSTVAVITTALLAVDLVVYALMARAQGERWGHIGMAPALRGALFVFEAYQLGRVSLGMHERQDLSGTWDMKRTGRLARSFATGPDEDWR